MEEEKGATKRKRKKLKEQQKIRCTSYMDLIQVVLLCKLAADCAGAPTFLSTTEPRTAKLRPSPPPSLSTAYLFLPPRFLLLSPSLPFPPHSPILHHGPIPENVPERLPRYGRHGRRRRTGESQPPRFSSTGSRGREAYPAKTQTVLSMFCCILEVEYSRYASAMTQMDVRGASGP